MADEVELIPGTTLPIHVGPGGQQREGRGDVRITDERMPRSLLEKIDDPASLTMTERAFVAAALRAFDRQPKLERTIYQTTSGETDATTGNLVSPLFVVPAGMEAHVSNVTADIPGSATITPSAPFANASSWAFLAVAGLGFTGAAQADTLRRGLVAFAPTSAAGPILPGQWTFNDSNAPVAFGGECVYFVIHGGSIAGLLAQGVQIQSRINLYSHT